MGNTEEKEEGKAAIVVFHYKTRDREGVANYGMTLRSGKFLEEDYPEFYGAVHKHAEANIGKPVSVVILNVIKFDD